ncbi:MAG: ABC transporter permease [Chitinophagaceae bacterium]
MNLPFFIARHLALHQHKTFSRFIVRLAIVAVSLSVAVMIIGSAITRGYQKTIREKFFACWGQIQIIPYTENPSNLMQAETFGYEANLHQRIQTEVNSQAVYPFLIQSGIIKQADGLDGILLKGYDSILPKGLYTAGLNANIQNLNSVGDSNFILLSEQRAAELNVKAGDKLTLLFVNPNQSTPKARRVFIKALYHTGLEEFDRLFAITSNQFLRQVNDLDSNAIQGYEVYLNENESLPIQTHLNDNIMDAPLRAYTLEERFDAVFSWLELMQTNEQIIWIIMLLIAVVNMATALLILMFERTRMIGLLKALGMTNASLSKLFLYTGAYICSVGLFIGNAIGLGVCLWQQYTGAIQLDEKVYYIREVPIHLQGSILLFINGLSLLLCVGLMLIPVRMLRTVSPVKALQFS